MTYPTDSLMYSKVHEIRVKGPMYDRYKSYIGPFNVQKIDIT